mmetsp:Transcript_3936/g.5650  ORF Transcript_3936/g.5650 Transcript_3936/m.5650 type:complete len:182 (+) Transcript_3936:75-620(+)|eukprot:CAMPEP_0184487316 /NCGR_PEP_ID=MMETSP0113_2-20130426/9757_1 /TAXON_ID=91329 /ORGANISM="Norrisiella sphaerica, Strain BC52" /LENGTH=181 /DNA_ID=CAMNT_0026869573 /DNA_START=61 /DNA_END=606 /DNA_ORIENTATION=+
MSSGKPIKVKLVVAIDEKNQGDVIFEVHPEWAPIGAERFIELVKDDFFTECYFHRVVENFVAQFGIAGDPEHYQKWASVKLKDDEVKVSNAKGYVSFATSGPNARSTQLFINLANNKGLDSQGFAPVAKVIEGMDVVEKLFTYGPHDAKPNQSVLKQKGNEYIKKSFPKLSYIKKAEILKE